MILYWPWIGLVFCWSSFASPGCQITEYSCANRKCVSINMYCDDRNDCGDYSDEPPRCTPCNRTYYGEVGKAYDISIHRPRSKQIPFNCAMTFHAKGGLLGDIIQVTFGTYMMGRLRTSNQEAGAFESEADVWAGTCEKGQLLLEEMDRQLVGGSWCGNAISPSHYYSETNSVKISLMLNRLMAPSRGRAGQNYNYDIRLTYKMLSKKDAVVRYGGGDAFVPDDENRWMDNGELEFHQEKEPDYYLGELISNTYCYRIFTDCDKRNCRLMSPGFPGIYARNLTCRNAIRQAVIPDGKHAMIRLSQPANTIIGLHTPNKPNSTTINYWKDCPNIGDYVTVYDGYSTEDPILLKWCGGGTAWTRMPEVISSGPELLVEFVTSPVGSMPHSTQMMPYQGFHLKAQVVYIENNVLTYTHKRRCEFWIQGSTRGKISSPMHTLPPNTTCLYHLQGNEQNTNLASRDQDSNYWQTNGRFKVWLSILQFSAPPLPGSPVRRDCKAQLQVWDAIITKPAQITCENLCNKSGENSTRADHPLVLAKYCRNLIPATCEHPLTDRPSRPCELSESHLSTKNSMTVELRLTESTALRPVSFQALYEFVDLHQYGEQWGPGNCSRKFQSKNQVVNSPHPFASARNVMLYGRGGTKNLSCTYRFEGQDGEKVKITITKIHISPAARCNTYHNAALSLTQCVGNGSAGLILSEKVPHGNHMRPKSCLCSTLDNALPYTYASTSNIAHVDFFVKNMNYHEDYRNYSFEGFYEFTRTTVCKMQQIVSGSSGEIRFRSPSRVPEETNCQSQPWLIRPSEGHFLYLKITGVVIGKTEPIVDHISADGVYCATKNRLVVYSGTTVHATICPDPGPNRQQQSVEILSEGWIVGNSVADYSTSYPPRGNITNEVVVQFLPSEPGNYKVFWLEISKRGSLPLFGSHYVHEERCTHWCPGLDACINGTLFCDGIEHCPDGYDESLVHCFFLLHLPALYAILLAIACVVAICACVCACRCICKNRPKSDDTQSMFEPKDKIC